MSSLDKLLKAFESVRLASTSGVQNTGMKLKKNGSELSSLGSSNPAQSSVSLEEPKSILDQSKAMASFASSLSQQGQNFLSKKEMLLSSRDKLSLCHSVTESIISGLKANSVDFQKLISIGIETLIVLIDDENPDVRMNADEALNRVIRCLSENHIGKIQLELFKEIKKNGSCRCLKAALISFSMLCHHIRPQKCRAYVQNLIPLLNIISKRTEESLQEAIALSFEKILPILGHFTNDNEIRNLLKAFLPNITHYSPSMRRSAVSCLVLLCQHSRKPYFFFLWILEIIIDSLLPQQEELPSHQVMGGLLLIRSLAPHFDVLCTSNKSQMDYHKEKLRGAELIMSYDQAIQVYELCLYYCSSSDHNVVAASLEALQSLLQNPCQHLLIALTSPEGITRSRIKGEKLPKFTSRNCSEISLATMGLEEDSLENMELSSLICHDDDLSNMSQSFRKSVAVTPDEKTLNRSMSLESSDTSQEISTLLYSGSGNPDNEINFEGNPLDEDGLGATSIPSGCVSTDEACKKAEVEGRSSSYSEIEIGQLSDTSLLLGRRDVDEESKDRSKKKNAMEEIVQEEGFTISEEKVEIQGNIGSFFDEDLPVKYLVRYISSSFLLSGHSTAVISDKVVKVSIKVLALNCIGYAISWHPSFFAETLFIPDNEEGASLEQYIYDILRYGLHSDPQLRWSIAVVVGQFIHSCLISNGGIYTDYGLSELNLDSLLDLLCNLLYHNSSVTVRGALAGLNICLPELLHSSHCSKVAIVVRHFLQVTANSYWLVKVDLCDLLSHLNLQYLDHIEGKALHIRINPSKEKTFQNFDKFSHEIVSSIFIPLLSDEDRRVRSAATNAISRLVPALLSEGDTVLKSCSQFILTDLFTVASSMEGYQLDYSSKMNSSVSLRLAPPPFDQVVDQETVKNVNQSGVKYLYWRNVDDNLSRLVSVLTTKLIMCNNKYLRVGILESLAQLCLDIPPTLHPKAWDCHVMATFHISSSETEKGCHLGLVTLLLSLAGESAIAGDLLAQQFILTICTNWLAGRAVLLLRQTSGEHIRERKQAWVFLQNPQLSHVAENLLQHILRILCVYTHLLEGVTPSTRSILVPIGPATVLSPIKRKSPLSATGDKFKANTSGISSEKSDVDEKDKKNKSSFKGSFAHLPEYIKLYDVLKNAFTNYKMSLDESAKEKFCDLLQHTLKGLGIILELAGMGEFGRVAEELLQYFKVTISILPTETIFCGQQLLKCLFGSNVVALWDHVFLDGPSMSAPQSEPEINHLPHLDKDGSASLYSLVFETPLSHLKKEFMSLHEGQMETLSLGQLKKRGSFLRLQAKTTDKVALSSYIRLFEPLVIKALKLYTISSDVTMQRSVLELLIHLVQIRVNYCLLDSEQIFIGYVIKQFEYIEEGQIKNARHIIPSMFSFLVLLSYERHHSKSIIGVPKIIQLCDGLMASGQHPLSHCVQALRPLVEDLFLERSYNSLVDQKELETQREVICSMLLRLVHYHQVVQLLSLVLISTHATNKDRWRKLSRQILDVLLPLISKLQVNIESKQALTSLEELLGRVCPSVFRPPDPFLKALLTSPSEIETTEDVERWVGGILLLLRVLISLSSIDMILARLEHLGLCMDYTISDSDKSMSSSLHLALSPKRYCKVEKDSTSKSSFIDPLNVTQPSVQPQVALARFLLEVIRVGIDELRSQEFTKLQRTIFSESSQLKSTPGLLDHLIYSFLLTVIHLAESGQWTPVMNSFKDLLHSLPEIVEEISDSLIFLSRWRPSLVVRWCQLLSKIDFPIPSLWTRVLLTSHKKSVGSPSNDATFPVEYIHQSMCLSVEFVRRNGLLVFSDFVLRHNQEGEWLPWLVVQHIKDIVLMYNELPIKALLQGIYASSSASALLIQAFHARCNLVHEAKYGVNVISIVSDIHKAQSGALVIFLIDRILATAYLMIGRLAAALCSQRLQLMLTEKDDGLFYLSGNDLTKLISKMKEGNLDKRYGQVYSLLHQVANAQQLEGFSMSPTEICSFTSPSNTLLNLNWYLQLVRNRCRSGEGGSQECSELLSCLDYDDALLVMSSKHFNLSLLPNAFRHSLMDTLKANRNWNETSGSAEAEDSSDCSSVNEVGSECPLLTACKMVLRQHLSKIFAIVPYPHAIFVPNSSNKYSSKLCKAFLNNEAVVKLIEVLSPSVTEMMTSFTSLPWQVKFDAEILEILTSFAVLNIELLHFLAYQKLLSVSIMSNCLKSVDLLLQNQEVFALICSGEKQSCVQSFVSSLHFIALYWIKPKGFPSLPANFRDTLKGDSDSLQQTCVKLMELVHWLENDGLRDIPTCLSLPIRGLVIALGRSPLLNAIVRTPPELWVLAWSPTLISESHSIMLPPVPADLFHESEVLKQFIFRLNLLGFIGRQQFEETWMQFLSVLNITLNAETPVEEIPYINLSISLAVRGVTSLLVQTMLLPCPGNPHNSTLLSVAKDKPPNYLTTLRGQKLQNMMRLLHLKLGDVQHITKGGSRRHLYSLHPGQVSVDYLVAAISSISDSQGEVDMLASYEFEMRKRQLESVGLDVESCIHFLHYLYSSWLNPPKVLCSSVIAEVVKSLSILCDLFTSASHHRWILETLIPFHASHPVEDFITFQYIIIATCKAFATLKSTQEEVSTSLSEGVLHIVENGLRSIQVSVRTCSLHGILYLLQAPLEESSPIISLSANYILKCKDGKSPECEGHEVALWEMWVYLVEHYKIVTHPTLPSTALHMALSTAASSCTSPRILHLVLRGVERLILVQQITSGTIEVILKLVMDLILNCSPAVSLPALPLFVTALHSSIMIQDGTNLVENRTVEQISKYPEDNSSDPEVILQFMEKLSILFDRIRVGYPFEAEVIAGLLGPCLLDMLPASQILNKVITEYISSHQPHPHLLASTLFQVFEAAMNEGGQTLVQEWVLLSLSNFTQRTPVSLAIWCLTCFFIAASNNHWLRLAFPSVQARLGKMEANDIQIFCLAAIYFRRSLDTEQQRIKFDDAFQSAATSQGFPFDKLLNYLNEEKKK